MVHITIDLKDEELKKMLYRSASEHGRTVEDEALAILLSSLAERINETKEPGGLGSAVHALFKPLGGVELDIPPREPSRDLPRFKK